MSAVRLTIVLCAAEVLSMAGTFAFPGLLPVFFEEWALSTTEAGWIAGLFYGGYTAAVPVLMSLTDRIDARRVYIAGALIGAAGYLGFALFAAGFWSALGWWALAGMGLAGTYMPGLRALVDRLGRDRESRAVAFYTSTFSLGTAVSFALAGEAGRAWGWRAPFFIGAAGAVLAAAIAFFAVSPARPVQPEQPTRLFDFGPVLKNRRAMGYVLGYGVHTLELFAYRSWLVAFLAFSLSLGDGPAFLQPTLVAMIAALVAMVSSVLGQEVAARFGRQRVIAAVMAATMIVAFGFGHAAPLPFVAVVAIALVYAALIQADSAALTAGVVSVADPQRRGATLAVHSVVGFAGAFVGPLALGIVLDLAGGAGRSLAWGLGFGLIGLFSLLGIAALFWSMRAAR